ncbi:MAG: MnmC family methyltransferase [Planctomycetota bacterium]
MPSISIPFPLPETRRCGLLRSCVLFGRFAKRGGILSTYSSAAKARLALMAAGWEIGLGPRVGRKSSGTVASRGSVDPPLMAPRREAATLIGAAPQ